jgi:uncharacterized protein YaiI (UPF0178 family)
MNRQSTMFTSPVIKTIVLYIDADACPVKQEIYRVAERHAFKGTVLKVFVVTKALSPRKSRWWIVL